MKTLIATTVALLFTAASFAQQGPGHQPTHLQNHPRVNQVNRREDNQERRVNTERRDGKISGVQARQDRRNIKTVNREKHAMRRADNGHLTKADQRSLNQQLNHNSRKIGH